VRPVICMVTAGAHRAEEDAALVQRIAAAARAGIHLVQIREPHLDGGPLARLVARCVEAVRGTSARVIVNERLDVALAAGAHGVHLRGDSMTGSRVRRSVPPGFLIGKSVRTPEGAERANGEGAFDYLIFGTVFPTTSKPGVMAAGLELLAAAAERTTLPVLAIGGVSIATAGAVARSGAAGFAAIGLFAHHTPEQLPATVTQASLAFDRLAGGPT
jgi:thiamine-phosphate diphosphorylase